MSKVEVPALTRVTNEYIEREDRLRILGETDDGNTCTLWITQRLLLRLLPRLLEWLEKEVPDVLAAEAIQEFRQQSANAALEPQAPVVPGGESAQWLLSSVDVTTRRQSVRLVFKGEAETQRIALGLNARALRQWLGVLHGQFRRAGWPMQIWPAWMTDAQKVSAPERVHLH